MSTITTTMSFIVSNKGHHLLVKDHFVYKVNKRTSLKTYWTCTTNNCHAHIQTDLNNNFLSSSGEHNQLLEQEDLQVKKFRQIVRSRVMNETAPVSKIYDEEISKAQFSPELLASVPLIHEIESGLNYPRRKLTPILPTSAVFDIPDSYHTTASGEKFLFCDTFIGRKKRMLLFGSPKQLELLFDSSIFPEAVHNGCHFHYNQSIYRRIQSLGLATAYSSDDEVRSCCKKLMSLAMMPLQEVETSFYNLRTETNSRVKQELRQLFLYFDQYWMTEVPLEIRFNRRIQRAHANIWSFITCLVGEERQFQHTHIRITTGAQRRPKSNAADGIQKRINVLNKQYNQQKIDAEQLLESLSMLVGKK
ncbi:unnamed protein product [Rotaria sp. Silwood1]|nr:unnamed protein product [Rotaria sp. Silwood1]